ncbi:lytic transglycosylase domain-containing protein [Oleiharenicola sp. Vm1]|uniref:lytic transglycosylase domain-containing protein n=1 Tax=Oleiharenicola sp. Vm1 TaxID=3398393 RepID=UPI0039F5A39D
MKPLRALPLLTLLAAPALAQPPAAPAKPAAEPEIDLDALYRQGKQLFDDYAPPEVKREFYFPSKQEWDAFAARLQAALDQNDLGELAAYEPEARAALNALRLFPDYADYAEWLEERLDYIQAAGVAARQPGAALPPKPPVLKPGQRPPLATPDIPYFNLWLARMRVRPAPARATALLPVAQAAFAAEGVPAELAWLAEVESTFNPSARSPAGARGLYQFMPTTAKALGLSTWLPDERTDPAKSARAAARYLRTLHGKFGDWPLALAAYNAGEGRVRRLLATQKARTFAAIAPGLPAETRMYVPKVLATLQVRAGVAPGRLAAPRAG